MPEPMPYTLTELFGWFIPMPEHGTDLWDDPKPCLRCGCAVLMPDNHVEFHNSFKQK